MVAECGKHMCFREGMRMNKQEIEENIAILKSMIPEYERRNRIFGVNALNTAISALEKQIAEKIEKDIVIDEDYSGNTYEREIPVCPSCNNIYLASKQSYCNQCGQKLDWSVEE